MFGTKMCDLHVPVRPGGDVAFANAVLKRAHRAGRDRRGLHRRPHRGVGRARGRPRRARTSTTCWPTGRADAGPSSRRSSTSTPAAGSAILLWSMGITQHRDAVDGVRAIVNLALARGNVGPRRRRAHADPRPLGRAGRGRDGGLRHGVARRRRRSTRPTPRSWREAWGFAVPTDAGPHRARDGRGGRAGRARRAVDVGRQLPRRAARPARASRPRSSGCRCASTRTSC